MATVAGVNEKMKRMRVTQGELADEVAVHRTVIVGLLTDKLGDDPLATLDEAVSRIVVRRAEEVQEEREAAA